MHPTFYLFGMEAPAYWLLSLMGMLAAGLFVCLSNRSGRRGRIPWLELFYLFAVCVLGLLAGGKLLYMLTVLPVVNANAAYVMNDHAARAALLTGGMVYYGGLFGGMLGAYLYCWRRRVPLAAVAGLMAPAIPLFHVFGRVGCFFAGCCYGVAAQWGLAFTVSAVAPNGVALIPVQLFEAGGNLLLFLLLLRVSKRIKRQWLLLPCYLLVYAIMRFLLEYLRGDPLRGVCVLSTSQWISLFVIGLAGGVCVLGARKMPAKGEEFTQIP